MPRVALDLNSAEDCRKVKGQWRIGPGLVPASRTKVSPHSYWQRPPRLADFDDSGWNLCADIRRSISKGLTFAWYRITVELPEQVNGLALRDYRVWFETNVDNYGEIWVDGQLERPQGRSSASTHNRE